MSGSTVSGRASGYDGATRERRTPEPAKRAASDGVARGDFERDRARVLHSHAFRRLADKTQVVVPGEDDFPRTRLTHSLEVAQISREIGAALGCDADVVDAAGLAHDIGHPPFGHNGEQALDAIAAPCGGFEGNAQTLRVLTRLEAKVLRPDGEPGGLNLCRATLDASCKYPWPRQPAGGKFGYYAADADAFEWLRAGAVEGVRCLEAQVMDWADDVAYSVHDVEDGVHAGMIKIGDVDRDAVCETAALRYADEPPEALAATLDRLLALPALADLAGYDGTPAGQVAAKRATSELVGRLSGSAVVATRAEHGPEPLRRYDASLAVPAATVLECALLKAIAARYVMERPGVTERQAAQRATLAELAEAVLDGAPGTLDRALVGSWRAAADDAARLRVVVDQLAQLTDTSAARWHARLVRPQ